MSIRSGFGLGPEYAKLWTATAISNIGDGGFNR